MFVVVNKSQLSVNLRKYGQIDYVAFGHPVRVGPFLITAQAPPFQVTDLDLVIFGDYVNDAGRRFFAVIRNDFACA